MAGNKPYISSTQTASSTPYDTTTSGLGTGDVQSAIDALSTNLGAGVSPFYQFTTNGALGQGSYLSVGQVPSNQVGALVPGTNHITKMAITTSQLVNFAATLQVQIRTGLGTFSDISGAALTIPGGNTAYKANIVFGSPIAIGPDVEISVYYKSGGGTSLQNPVVLVFVQPN